MMDVLALEVQASLSPNKVEETCKLLKCTEPKSYDRHEPYPEPESKIDAVTLFFALFLYPILHEIVLQRSDIKKVLCSRKMIKFFKKKNK
jgi:hypothetical protein